MSASLLDSSPDRYRTRRPRRMGALVIAVVVCLGLVLGACGDDDGSGGGSGAGQSDAVAELPEVADSEYEDMTGQESVTIDTRDNTFAPQYVTVSPGTEVVFENRGRNQHNVIAVEQGAFTDIPTEDLEPGATASIVFDDSGDYPYYCSLHATPSRGMTGRIRVAQA